MEGRIKVADLLQASRPLLLLESILLYGLGVAIARYLGRPIRVADYFTGQGLILLIMLSATFLASYYEAGDALQDDQPPGLREDGSALVPGDRPRRQMMYAAIISLTLAGTLASMWFFACEVPTTAWMILLLGSLAGLAYSLPSIGLATSGFGEVILSLIFAGFIPTFSFTLQTGELHRFLWMSTAPLICLHFAMLIVFELPHYARDVKHERGNMMVRLGWSTAMCAHDVAVILAFALFILAFLNGLPQRVAFGSIIAIPLGLAQVWQVWRIRNAYPPQWRNLTWGGAILFALSAYLILAGYMLS